MEKNLYAMENTMETLNCTLNEKSFLNSDSSPLKKNNASEENLPDAPASSVISIFKNKNKINPIARENIVISGVGYYHPEERVTNEELVYAYNKYAENFNKLNESDIQLGKVVALKKSSSEYIESVSGIKSRYVRDKKNLLDPEKLWPKIEERGNNDLSMQAEVCVYAAKKAMEASQKKPEEIDAVILASCHKQRDMPPVSVEIQNALGIKGFSYDMSMACSSAIYGIHAAVSNILAGTANTVLVVSPEIKSGQFDMKDPDSNFLFGEATAAVIIERASTSRSKHNFKICDISLSTAFSNNIRNNRGAYNNCDPDKIFTRDKLFHQNGRLVYKDVTRLTANLIFEQLKKYDINPNEIGRFWLHQANQKINRKIISLLLGSKEHDQTLAPEILSEFANVSSAGVLIAFSKNHQDLAIGKKTILCAFGAGYSIGSILLEKNN